VSYPIRKGFKRVTGLFAFWRYDLFPHVLGGPVMAMNDKGLVQVETYGGGVFRPIKLVPRAQGTKMLVEIERLCREHREASLKFAEQWRATVVHIVGPEVEKDREIADNMRAAKKWNRSHG